jgi:hypothetical protein
MSEITSKSLRNVYDIAKEECEWLSPDELLTKASEVPEAPRTILASDYGETINHLRQKGYTWKEITDWFSQNKIELSMGALISGWRSWAKWQAI